MSKSGTDSSLEQHDARARLSAVRNKPELGRGESLNNLVILSFQTGQGPDLVFAEFSKFGGMIRFEFYSEGPVRLPDFDGMRSRHGWVSY